MLYAFDCILYGLVSPIPDYGVSGLPQALEAENSNTMDPKRSTNTYSMGKHTYYTNEIGKTHIYIYIERDKK